MKKIPCQVYSRVVGYIRPTSWWNKAKQQEFRDRVTFKQPEKEQLEKMNHGGCLDKDAQS